MAQEAERRVTGGGRSAEREEKSAEGKEEAHREKPWRKLVGVEPTCDTKYRTTGLKPAPSTGQE